MLAAHWGSFLMVCFSRPLRSTVCSTSRLSALPRVCETLKSSAASRGFRYFSVIWDICPLWPQGTSRALAACRGFGGKWEVSHKYQILFGPFHGSCMEACLFSCLFPQCQLSRFLIWVLETCEVQGMVYVLQRAQRCWLSFWEDTLKTPLKSSHRCMISFLAHIWTPK